MCLKFKVTMKEIKRNSYLKQLISGKQNGLIKIVTGIRRCGKSYLLFKIFRNHLLEQEIIQVDKQNSRLIMVRDNVVFDNDYLLETVRYIL